MKNRTSPPAPAGSGPYERILVPTDGTRLSRKAEQAAFELARAMAAAVSDVAKAIVEHAVKQKCDLIVMASHGRRGLDRLLLGSETQHVLLHSSLPVLVVR